MTALAIAGVSLQRLVRDPRALFFVIALPVLVIVIIGATVRGFTSFPVGVVDLGSGHSGEDVVGTMQRSGDIQIHRYGSAAAAIKGVARGEVTVAVILPSGMDRSLRSGRVVSLEVLSEQANSSQQAAITAVRSAIGSHAARVQAAVFASSHGAGTFERDLALATALAKTMPLLRVHSVQVDSRSTTLPEGFSYSAPTMLVLFVFINTLAGSGAIVDNRRLGMYERMSAAPVRPGDIIAGETLGLLARSVLQAALIVAVGAVGFGVSWGNPLAAAVLVAIWALVSAGAGVLAGTLFRTQEQASGIGSILGVLLGMLGGCMWPLSIVSPAIRTVGHITPQAWAVDAWTALIARGVDITGIGTELAVLTGFGAALILVASERLGRVVAR